MLGGIFHKDKNESPGPWDIDALEERPFIDWIETEDRIKSLYYANEPYHGEETRIYAMYSYPLDVEEPVPGVVLVHGGGGRVFPEWVEMWEERGYAALAMDLSGSGADGERLDRGAGPDQGHQQKFEDIRDGIENTWPYHAVAAVVRATTVLSLQPEVDSERIGMTGISWGGYLTCIAAGLDERVRAAVPVYGCGFLHESSCWVPILDELPQSERETWIEKFDPSHYIRRAKPPMLWVTHPTDDAYKLDSHRKSYEAQPGPKALSVQPGLGHSHEAGWSPDEIELFFNSHFGSEEPLPRIEWHNLDEKTVAVSVEAITTVKDATLYWTTDTCDWPEREWFSGEARGRGAIFTAELPEERPLNFFMNVTDERGATVSTPYRTFEQKS
ncbi:MAG: alpha/beta hydrolase family protein [Candidatus Brocadiia bacterium]